MEIVKGLIIIIGVMVAIGSIILVCFDGKIPFVDKKNNTKKSNNNKKDKKNNKEGNLDKTKEEQLKSTQEVLEFDRIESINPENPKGILVNKEKEYIGYIGITGINYNLLSIEERIRLESNFQQILNGLEFPIQIYVQSRKLDIDNYNNLYTKRLNKIKDQLHNLAKKYEVAKRDNSNDLDIIENKYNKVLSQYTYGKNIFNYTMERCNSKDMLIKKYYIVIKHKPTEDTLQLDERERLLTAFYDIDNKSAAIINALKRSDLNGRFLSPLEVGELIYSAYNKSESDILKLQNCLKARFNSLVVSSTPVEVKELNEKINKVDELQSINNEEIKKIKQKKDYDKLEID